MSEWSVCIVVLNYRGKDLLPRCLPSLELAVKKARVPARVMILNNPGPEDGLDYARKNFPQVEIYQASQNKILCSYNELLPKLRDPVVILLNNDIKADEDFIDPLVESFKRDSRTFLAAPKVLDFEGKTVQAGRTKAGMKFGLFWSDARYHGYEKEVDKPSETFSSGFGAFDRVKFLELGGYDERYLPGIMEDADLSYRAQQAGYKLYYEPKSVVYHIGQVSFKKAYGARGTAILAHRNNFLFMWKNFSGFRFWAAHLFFLPLRLIFAVCRGNWPLAAGFFQALNQVCKGRKS